MNSPLTVIVRDRLEPILRQHLSSLTIEMAGAEVAVRLSFALYGNSPSARTLRHTISVSDAPLPPGVSMAAFTRWPDALYELPTDPDAVQQIRDLQDSGLVGSVNWHRFDHGAGEHHWLVKTHAGSAKERASWLLSLPWRS